MAQINGQTVSVTERNRMDVDLGSDEDSAVYLKITNQTAPIYMDGKFVRSGAFNVANIELDISETEHLISLLQQAVAARKR